MDEKGNIKPLDPAIKRLQETFEIHKKLFDNMPTTSFKFAMAHRPLEYAETELLTNIRVQVSEHYLRYQKAYLRERIRQYLQSYGYSELKRIQLGALAHQVQRAVNYDGILEEFSDKHLSKKNISKMMKPLQTLCTVLHREIPEELRYLSEAKRKQVKLLPIFVMYLHQMAQFLTQSNLPSFSPLPNPNLQRRNMLCDKRFLYVIYNEWMNEKIVMKDFEANYTKYYSKLFNTHNIFRQKYNKCEIPKSYSTNGYAVSVIFSPKKEEIIINAATRKRGTGQIKASKESNQTKKLRISKDADQKQPPKAITKEIELSTLKFHCQKYTIQRKDSYHRVCMRQMLSV
jgi:hypothetical protein